MTDPLPLLRALEGPPAPARAPAWPVPRRRRLPLLLAAAGTAALVLGVGWWTVGKPRAPGLSPDQLQPGWTTRGADAAPSVDLRLAVQRGEDLERHRRGQAYAVGDRIYLQLAASAPAVVTAWVIDDGERQNLGSLEATREPQQLRSAAGLVAYECSEPGTIEVCASTLESATCEAPSCQCWPLEIR